MKFVYFILASPQQHVTETRNQRAKDVCILQILSAHSHNTSLDNNEIDVR